MTKRKKLALAVLIAAMPAGVIVVALWAWWEARQLRTRIGKSL